MTTQHPYPHLFEPIMLGPVEVSNRIVRSAHGTVLAVDGLNDAFIEYHERRAADGVGMTVLEYTAVHPSSTTPQGITAWNDDVIDGYLCLTERMRPYGMRVFQQLHHGGAHAIALDGGAPWAPSQVTSIVTGAMPLAMSRDQIAEVVQGFASAARRARDGGLDGVEIQACHSFLPAQFLSPMTNHRHDQYGGSFENRIRFVEDILRAVRAQTGSSFSVGVRLSASELIPGGMNESDATAIALHLEAAGLIDFVSLSLGGRHSYPKIIAAMQEPHGYELEAATAVAAKITVPTIVGGRLTTLAAAEQVLAETSADMVSLVRATIADDHLIRKSVSGRAATVRECIGCNHGCVAKPNGPLTCAISAEAGRELSTYDGSITDSPRRIAVVGGGPAGMEAARVAALRGDRVVLFEAEAELGGQLRYARRAPLRAEIGVYADWLIAELERLEVEVKRRTRATGEWLRAAGFDAVVVATGSVPRLDGRQAVRPLEPVEVDGSVPVLSSWDLLSDAEVPPGQVVVVDDVGHYEAIAVIDELRRRGNSVVVVSRFGTLGTAVERSLSAEPARARFEGAGYDYLAETRLVGLRNAQARIASVLTAAEHQVPAVAAILVTGNRSADELVTELRDGSAQVIAAGDAISPRFLLWAVREGHAAGLQASGAPEASSGAGHRSIVADIR